MGEAGSVDAVTTGFARQGARLVGGVTFEARPRSVEVDPAMGGAFGEALRGHAGEVGLLVSVTCHAASGILWTGDVAMMLVAVEPCGESRVAGLASDQGVRVSGDLTGRGLVATRAELGAVVFAVTVGAFCGAVMGGLVAAEAARVESGSAVASLARRRLRLPEGGARGVAGATGAHLRLAGLGFVVAALAVEIRMSGMELMRPGDTTAHRIGAVIGGTILYREAQQPEEKEDRGEGERSSMAHPSRGGHSAPRFLE